MKDIESYLSLVARFVTIINSWSVCDTFDFYGKQRFVAKNKKSCLLYTSSYKGLTPEEVLTGWLFYYDSWKNEPIIRIKSNEARKLLEIEGNYACLLYTSNKIF